MASNDSYRRYSRPHATRATRNTRSEPPADAVVVALTAQVLACILLLVVAVLARQMNQKGYNEVKQQYILLVSDPGQGAEVFDGIADMGSRLPEIFASIEGFITAVIERFAGDPMAGESPVAEVVPEPDVDEPTANESTETPSPTKPAADFGYNYLSAGDIVQTGLLAEPSQSLGQGGMYPVPAVADRDSQPAPAGATFAPVILSGRLKPPVTGVITSDFSYRDHPVTGSEDFHNGIDIAAPAGRNILAALPGRVEEVGESAIYGKTITIRHGSNLQTFYAHCDEIIAAEGAVVRQGERVARVGSTGMTTGPHLHFSVLVDGVYTDPCWVLKDNIQPVG